MRRGCDLTGQRFGRLIAIKRIGSNKHNEAIWLCKCDCGNYKETIVPRLKSGKVKSCGCLEAENRSDIYKRQKESNSPKVKKGNSKKFAVNSGYQRIYRIWTGMKSRCYNSNTHNYKYYGGRGIEVCEEWKEDFQAFYDWSIANGYSENLTIDREDTNGNYEPSNCRWITKKEQAQNTRQTKTLTYNGEEKTYREWSEITGIPKETIKARISNGWSTERALTEKVKHSEKRCIG